jgi:DNA adenine methylase
VTDDSFIYCDPPYRPISRTSSFNSYSSEAFGDDQQSELAEFVANLDRKGASVMVSNSWSADGFFQSIYEPFQVLSLRARRILNGDAATRNYIDELLIINS